MTSSYGCVCCAIPRKLVQHLADQADGEQRELLQAQISHTSKLRAQRSVQSKIRPTGTRGEQLLHRQVFDAQGRTVLPGRLLRDHDDPPTSDKQADQAWENVGIVMRFYRTVLGRDSADGRGMRMDASVHYGFRFANAMWTGRQMIIGDGDGRHVQGLAQSLGIIAHEYSHAVSQHLVRGGLGVVQVTGQPPALKGEAGALNESFSDVFASMVKQWHQGQDVQHADWLLGEDVLAPAAGKAIRSIKRPGDRAMTWSGDDQIADYRQFRATDDAHRASGIGNRAFYIAAATLGGNSWERLAAIWLKGFDRLRARATFLDAAHATVDVAAVLQGKGSPAHRAVKAGWRSANVLS